jgi:hypothetical protein
MMTNGCAAKGRHVVGLHIEHTLHPVEPWMKVVPGFNP